eukprot:5714922-Prymnesium_polylepis.1
MDLGFLGVCTHLWYKWLPGDAKNAEACLLCGIKSLDYGGFNCTGGTHWMCTFCCESVVKAQLLSDSPFATKSELNLSRQRNMIPSPKHIVEKITFQVDDPKRDGEGPSPYVPMDREDFNETVRWIRDKDERILNVPYVTLVIDFPVRNFYT